MSDTIGTISLRRATSITVGTVNGNHDLGVEEGLSIAKLQILGRAPEKQFLELLGWTPPPSRHQAEFGGLTAAWLAPGEWLLCGPEAEVTGTLARLHGALPDDAFAVDLTHARTSLILEGSHARGALSAHCPLDLWPAAFPIDSVARTPLGDTTMFIARLGDRKGMPRFRIIVDQTMGPYAVRMLAGPPNRAGADH